MEPQVVLILATDHFGWNAVADTLANIPDVQVVGGQISEGEARDLIAKHCLTVVIAAEQVDGRSTAPFLEEIRTVLCPTAKLAVLTSRMDRGEVRKFRSCRLSAYLLWDDVTTRTLAGIISLLLFAEVRIASRVIAEAAIVPRPAIAASRSVNARGDMRLSDREHSVLRHLAEGLTMAEIAATGGWSQRTVARDIEEIEAKLDAPSRFVLAYKATLLELLP